MAALVGRLRLARLAISHETLRERASRFADIKNLIPTAERVECIFNLKQWLEFIGAGRLKVVVEVSSGNDPACGNFETDRLKAFDIQSFVHRESVSPYRI